MNIVNHLLDSFQFHDDGRTIDELVDSHDHLGNVTIDYKYPIGTPVRSWFPSFGKGDEPCPQYGWVDGYVFKSKFYRIKYDGGDSENLPEDVVAQIALHLQ